MCLGHLREEVLVNEMVLLPCTLDLDPAQGLAENVQGTKAGARKDLTDVGPTLEDTFWV